MSNKTTYSPDNIQTLNWWRESIRKRPGMYIGKINAKGFMAIILGLLSNVFQKTASDYIQLELQEKDSGKIRLNNINLHLKDSWAIEHAEIPSPFWMEPLVLNSLSSKFKISFFDKNHQLIQEQHFKKGILTKGKIENKMLSCQHLEMTFTLDKEIWNNNLVWDTNYICHKIKTLAYLHKTKKFEINYHFDKDPCRVIYQFKNGLQDRINLARIDGFVDNIFPTYVEKKLDTCSIELAFTFCSSVDAPLLKTYVNDSITHQGGTHVTGLIKGIRIALKNYVLEKNFEEIFDFSTKKITQHLIAALHVKIEHPTYAGCTRNILTNQEVIKPITNLVSEILIQKFHSDEEQTKSILWGFEKRRKFY